MRGNQSSWTPKRAKLALKERQSSCIPSEVVETVPACALSCVENFIVTEYSTSCANTSSLEFLCTTSNPSGFALGEAGLQCIISNCSSTSSEGSVYRICAGIQGSIPETIAVITATVAPMATSTSIISTTLPPTIARPSTTPTLSTFASATGSPSVVTPIPPTAAPVTTATATNPTTSSTTRTTPEAATTTAAALARVQTSTLSTGAIAGIAVGGVAAIAGVISLLFLLICLRKKRRSQRPASQRWSIGAFPPTPPGKDVEQASNASAPTFSPNQRFYASAAAPEENRRSFWRKSINPQDIGVAVSPGKMVQASPASLLSEKSASGLLTNTEAPSMWPAPLMTFPVPPKGVPRRPGQPGPVFDEQQNNGAFNREPTFEMVAPYETRLSQVPQQLGQTSYSRPLNPGPGFGVQAPYETRLSGVPEQTAFSRAGPPLASSQNQAPYETRLSGVPQQQTLRQAGTTSANSQDKAYNAERVRGAAITGRIPLTPVYDNGNFATTSQGGRSAPVAYRWDTPESMDQLSQAVPPAAPRSQMGLNISNATPEEIRRRNESAHRSVASDSTTFEEDMTPEEERDRQLRLAQSRSLGQYSNEVLERIPEGDTSPIKNLAYPQIPRPAAVSRQAQQIPRPLAAQKIVTAESAPAGLSRGLSRRYELARAGQSYLLSESSSSTTSAPSLLAQRRIGQQKDLRIKTSNAASNALNSRWQVSTQPVVAPLQPRKNLPAKTLQTRPSLKENSPKARVTPKTNSRGDLYLTVED